MKTPLKTLACAIAAAFALFACEDTGTNNPNNNSAGNDYTGNKNKDKGALPVMSDKVVSYQTARYIDGFGFEGIVTDTDTLKLWFPNDYDEQREECNYFAAYNSTNSTRSGYLILAQDMVLYSLMPSNNICPQTEDIFYEAMLVCDDEASTIKNKLSRVAYTVPGWDCTKWETEPEKGFFPIHPIPPVPKPVMESRVVSYQNVQYTGWQHIITNADTLELWFPHIFANGQAKSECNYFAMTFDHRDFHYEPVILSKDTINSGYILSDVRPGVYGENCKSVTPVAKGSSGALLICDDDAYTIKNIIKSPIYEGSAFYYINLSTWLDPDWDCESGIGAPTLEEIFF